MEPSEEPPATQQMGRTRKCPHCDKSIPTSALRCRYCGEEVESDVADDDQPWETGNRFRGRRDTEPHRGTLILVLGILSMTIPIIGLPLGIPAMVMARMDRKKIRAHQMDREGEGLTDAGWVCGLLGVIIQSAMLLACVSCVGLGALPFMGMRPPPPTKIPATPQPAVPPPGNR
jgi:hypothetical protein